MTSHVSYSPMLADKRGELQALAGLSEDITSQIIPFVAVRHPEVTTEQGRERLPNDVLADRLLDPNHGLLGCWGVGERVFVDPDMIADYTADGDLAWMPFSMLLNAEVQVVPVTGRDRPSAHRRAAVRASRRAGLGAAIRVRGDDLGAGPAGLAPVLRELDLPRSEIDLFVDLGYLDGTNLYLVSQIAASAIRSFGNIADFRSVRVAAGSFPPNLSEHMAYEDTTTLPRAEVDLFARAVTALDSDLDTSRLQLGDYGIAHPDFEVRAHRGAANIRYSRPNEWIVHRGPHRDEAGPNDYRTLARELVGSAGWLHDEHCEGCRFMVEKTALGGGPGNSTQWKEACTSHHLAVTVSQIAN